MLSLLHFLKIHPVIDLKKYVLLFIFLLCLFSASALTFIGHTQITITDSARQNRSIPVEIYYPSDSTGDNVPLSILTSAKFPLIVFGHGFLMSWESYEYLWQNLVPQGYIMVFPTTEGGFSPQHLEFAKDLAFLNGAMKNLGMDSTSLFYNRLDSTSCIMGHSMGGGAAVLSVQFDSTITAMVNFAAAETNPSAITASGQISIPVLLFSGANDCVTPPSTNQLPMFDSLNSSCKFLVNIIGGSHCQMADDNFYCNIGESSCSPPPLISRLAQHDIIVRYLLPWLDVNLRYNCSSGSLIDSLLLNDPEISFNTNCTLCSSTTEISNLTETDRWLVYPNPFRDFISFKNGISDNSSFYYQLFDLEARLIDEGNVLGFESEKLLETSEIETGLYFLKLFSDTEFNTFKLFKFRN